MYFIHYINLFMCNVNILVKVNRGLIKIINVFNMKPFETKNNAN